MHHRRPLSLLVLLLPLATSGCLLPYAVPAIPNPTVVGEPRAYSLTGDMWGAIDDYSKTGGRELDARPERIVGAELLPEGVLVVACEWSDGTTRVFTGAGRADGCGRVYADATYSREAPPDCEEVEDGVRLPGTTTSQDPQRVQPGDVLSLQGARVVFSKPGGPTIATGALSDVAYDQRPRGEVGLKALGVLGTPFTLCADAGMLGLSVVTFAVLLPPAFLWEWLDD